jgi:hypothetical protein
MSMSNKSSLKVSPKPTARLDASLLLARKGEASPAVAATQYNNPGLAWGAPPHPGDFQPHPKLSAKPTITARLRPDSFFAAHGRGNNAMSRTVLDRDPVTLTVRVEDETYLRLKYLAQRTGCSPQQVLAEALDDHLARGGVPHSRKLVIISE